MIFFPRSWRITVFTTRRQSIHPVVCPTRLPTPQPGPANTAFALFLIGYSILYSCGFALLVAYSFFLTFGTFFLPGSVPHACLTLPFPRSVQRSLFVVIRVTVLSGEIFTTVVSTLQLLYNSRSAVASVKCVFRVFLCKSLLIHSCKNWVG